MPPLTLKFLLILKCLYESNASECSTPEITRYVESGLGRKQDRPGISHALKSLMVHGMILRRDGDPNTFPPLPNQYTLTDRGREAISSVLTTLGSREEGGGA